MDLTTLSDDDLAQHKRDVLIEEERRQARDQIPAQIADLKARFIDAGGDPNDLLSIATDDAPDINPDLDLNGDIDG